MALPPRGRDDAQADSAPCREAPELSARIVVLRTACACYERQLHVGCNLRVVHAHARMLAPRAPLIAAPPLRGALSLPVAAFCAMSATVSARQAGREAAARAVEKGTLSLRKASARASLLSPPRAGLADISNSHGCVRRAQP